MHIFLVDAAKLIQRIGHVQIYVCLLMQICRSGGKGVYTHRVRNVNGMLARHDGGNDEEVVQGSRSLLMGRVCGNEGFSRGTCSLYK